MGFLKGKTAIITGAGFATLSDGRCGSIGYGIATAYAKEGANLVITGRNVQKLEKAKEELEKLYGIKVLIFSADIAAGSDKEAIVKAAQETGRIITVEEHNMSGGLGSAVAEVLLDEGCTNVKMKRIALPDVYVHEVGSQQWLREQYHLTAPYIAEEILNICK